MNNGLVGAVFPVTGLPDLPGSSKVDAPKPQMQMQPQQQLQPQQQPQQQPQLQQLQPPGGFAPEMLTRLQGLDPQQQRLFMQQLMVQQQNRQRQRQQLQHHQQQQLQQHRQQTGAMQQEVQAPVPGVGMQNMSPFSNAANLPMNMFVSYSIVRVWGYVNNLT